MRTHDSSLSPPFFLPLLDLVTLDPFHLRWAHEIDALNADLSPLKSFVLLLSGYHGWMVGYAKKLARGKMKLSGKQLRMINEVPALAAALIVVLVVIKPF